MADYPTPHINASPSDFAETVLMPGDPMRAKFIAENYLENARLVNNVRGIHGYTGEYKGVPVSVMASGMGMPSIGIYSYELFSFFGVNNIIRIGSAGALAMELNLFDIVIAQGACTNSNYASMYNLGGTYAPIASYPLLAEAVKNAEKHGAVYKVGNVLSSDNFYSADPDASKRWADMGVLAIEMEAAALYMNAAKCRKNALAICTVSDHIFKSEATTAEQRETSFTNMMEIALDTAIQL